MLPVKRRAYARVKKNSNAVKRFDVMNDYADCAFWDSDSNQIRT